MKHHTITLVLLIALRFSAVAGSTSAQEHEYIPWMEPSRTFGMMVPADWQVQGAAHDLLGIGILPQLIAISPDGTQVVTMGADQVFAFVEPNANLGIAEGDTLPIGITALPLYHPSDFLSEYLHMWLVDGGTCQQLDITPVLGTAQEQESYLSSEVDLTCVYSEGQATGRYYVGIYIVNDANLGRLWIVGDLFGYLADAGEEAGAQAVLSTVVQTLSFAPQDSTPAGTDGGDYGYDAALSEGSYGTNEMDAPLAQQMNAQINQMVNTHSTSMMVNQMNWFQQNQEMIMGIRTEYDTQYEYQWEWEQR